jgi:hypothetical protein
MGPPPAGSELRQPLGIAIVGGLLVSQVLTLCTTPVVYPYVDRLRLQPGGGGPSRARETGLDRAPAGAHR